MDRDALLRDVEDRMQSAINIRIDNVENYVTEITATKILCEYEEKVADHLTLSFDIAVKEAFAKTFSDLSREDLKVVAKTLEYIRSMMNSIAWEMRVNGYKTCKNFLASKEGIEYKERVVSEYKIRLNELLEKNEKDSKAVDDKD
jgi:hypothetical protein